MEAFPLRAVAHDERLTVTEHLTGFGALMPQVIMGLDDETPHIEALRSEAPDLGARGKSNLRQAESQILLTERSVNTIWPVPATAAVVEAAVSTEPSPARSALPIVRGTLVIGAGPSLRPIHGSDDAIVSGG